MRPSKRTGEWPTSPPLTVISSRLLVLLTKPLRSTAAVMARQMGILIVNVDIRAVPGDDHTSGGMTPDPGGGAAFLGPMTAMNGVLLFGRSTAVIVEVLRKTLQRSDNISG